jgi:oligopeptide transport system substrate-binding protein
MNFKKIFSLVLVFVFVFIIAACSKKEAKVTFDSNGGTPVKAITVKIGEKISEPEDPTKEGYTFTGWYTDKECTKLFDFSTPIKGNMTLYAGWTTEIVVRFNTQTSATIESVTLPIGGGSVDKPTAPTRDGYRFGGWFRGKPGLTWLEPEPVQFPLTVTSSLTLYAYWEPVNSKAVNYADEETYITSIVRGASLILNPLVYQYSHEDDFIDMMVTPMYSTEVDWAKAIEDGVADYIGDFSKIEAKEFSIEAFDYHYIKVGATRFPMDEEGNEYLTPEGTYDRDNASKITADSWIYHIREDLKFEDGTPITADTFEYTLKQYLDPEQNNYRSTIFYKDEVEKNGYPILNASEYRKQIVNNTEVAWDDVGFEVLDDYSFKVIFYEQVSQASAVGLANSLRLVHPLKYEASLTDGINSTYGTPDSPYVSYGAYILKSWDENQMLVFNKNYEYVAKETINYKSQVIQIVDSIATQTQLYINDQLSVLGLNNENYAEFAEEENLKRSWNGYPQYIAINLAESRLDSDNKHQQPSILFDKRFRQALFYGFDRKYYNASVYAPNVPSILPIPADAKAYLQDALLFSESPQHLGILDKHGIDPSTYGYIPQRAKQLFDAAYDDWLEEENSGPVVLKLVSSNENTLVESLANYIESNYEKLFNGDDYDPQNPEKFDIQIQWGTGDTTDEAQKQWEFDIALLNVGFGASYGSHWQYPFIAFLGADLGGANLGLSQPYDKSQPDGKGKYYHHEITVDFTNTYEYLLDIRDTDNWQDDYDLLLDKLEEDEDKAAGIYKGTAGWLGLFVAGYNTPWDATAAEPFTGATQDLWNMLAQFEDVFFEYVPMVPTSTRASATVYKPYVKILWPEYSVAFGWGANRYRYLSSDPTMSDGLYNSYKAAYEAEQQQQE